MTQLMEPTEVGDRFLTNFLIYWLTDTAASSIRLYYGNAHDPTFRLEQDELEIPTFDNAEGLVDRLVRRGLLVRDEIVEGGWRGARGPFTPARCSGTSWRRWADREAAGADPPRRPRPRAARGGQAGHRRALELGYSDQAHLTRALKAIMGKTSGQVARDPL